MKTFFSVFLAILAAVWVLAIMNDTAVSRAEESPVEDSPPEPATSVGKANPEATPYSPKPVPASYRAQAAVVQARVLYSDRNGLMVESAGRPQARRDYNVRTDARAASGAGSGWVNALQAQAEKDAASIYGQTMMVKSGAVVADDTATGNYAPAGRVFLVGIPGWKSLNAGRVFRIVAVPTDEQYDGAPVYGADLVEGGGSWMWQRRGNPLDK